MKIVKKKLLVSSYKLFEECLLNSFAKKSDVYFDWDQAHRVMLPHKKPAKGKRPPFAQCTKKIGNLSATCSGRLRSRGPFRIRPPGRGNNSSSRRGRQSPRKRWSPRTRTGTRFHCSSFGRTRARTAPFFEPNKPRHFLSRK